MDAHTLFVLEAASILHDIGIRVSEEKYGFQNGKLQEQEGNAQATRQEPARMPQSQNLVQENEEKKLEERLESMHLKIMLL